VQAYGKDQLRALADPTRLAVFERLAKGPAAVQEIANGLPVSRPAVSQHLRVLKEARLVLDEQIGTRRFYRLDPEGIQAIRAYFEQFWGDALAAFKAFAEDQPQPRTNDAKPRTESSRSKDRHRKH
jgi:DNA-binding transcriptional ArsR family regulator